MASPLRKFVVPVSAPTQPMIPLPFKEEREAEDRRAALSSLFKKEQEKTDASVGAGKNVIGEPEDELGTLAANALRAMVNQGKPPEAAQEFKNSISPGRELLANVLFGMSASFSGEKFRSVRERKFEEFVTQRKLAQEEEQQRQQKSTQTMAAVTNLLQLRQQAKNAAINQDIKRLGLLNDDREYDLKVADMIHRHGVDIKTIDRLIQKDNIEASTPKDSLFQTGKLLATQDVQRAGLDPNSTAGQEMLWNRTVERANEIYDFRERHKNKKTSGGSATTGLRIDWSVMGDGSRVPVVVDLKNPVEPMNMPVFPRSFGAEEQRGVQLTEASVQSFKNAVKIFSENPDAKLGSILNQLPTGIQAAIGHLKPGERAARMFFDKAVFDRIVAQSGLAFTDKERAAITSSFPRYFEKPETFLPGAMALTLMMDTSLFRQRNKITVDELDMSDVMAQTLGEIEEAIKKHPKMKINLPSAQTLAEAAAKRSGKRLVKIPVANQWRVMDAQ